MQASLSLVSAAALTKPSVASRSSIGHVACHGPHLVVRPARRQACRQTLVCRAEAAAAPGAAAVPTPAAAPKKAEVDHVAMVLADLAANNKVVIAQTAPAVRVSIGEEMGLPPGTACTGKLVAALKLLGFDYVFDTLVGADMTIMEEGHELLERLEALLSGRPDEAKLPMFTSCCPGWVGFVEQSAPEMIPFVSSTKSPHMIVGSIIKTYFSKKIGRDASDLSVVSIMPCVKKQGEADRIMMQTEGGHREVDHVLTTRDLGQILRDRGIDLASLPDEPYDDFLGTGSGAAALFGSTGGVMEAALRTVYDVVTGEKMPRLQFSEVRGLEGVKEASITISPHPEGPLHNVQPVTLNIAVANGLGNAKKLIKAVKEGNEKQYHFVEVMACPGGCIGGGGQPRSKVKDILQKRQAALYSVDERMQVRRSYESPVVQKLYEEWLGQPGSHEAHARFHTTYEAGGPAKFDIASQGSSGAAPACASNDSEEPWQPSPGNQRPQSSIKARRQRTRGRSSASEAPAASKSGLSSFINAGLISGSLSLAGDVVAQLMANHNKQAQGSSYDVARAARMGSFGLCLYGPGQLVWYRALDARFPGRTLANFAAKVLLNQTALAPMVITSVFAWNLALQGKLGAWPDKVRQDFLPTLLAGWKFWVPAASLNFAVVPLKYQVLYMSCCGVVWTAILSSSSARKQQQQQAAAAAAAPSKKKK